MAPGALVISLRPEPARRRRNGSPAARRHGRTYAWDMVGADIPGADPCRDARDGPCFCSKLRRIAHGGPADLWTAAGLDAIETREITVLRTFADFDDFWAISLMSRNIGPIVAAISAGDAERLKTRVHARLPADEAGHITYAGRANAVKGCVPQ